jgi:integration host factor subunit beta
MNRSDLIDKLATRFSSLSKNDTELAVNTISEALSNAMVSGHRVEIRGFASFLIKQRQSRIHRNPRNGESVAIPERRVGLPEYPRVAHFKPAKALRESVDNCGEPA